MTLVALLAMAAWFALRLLTCERCGVPFSVPGVLYQVLTFEEHRCRRCRDAAMRERAEGRDDGA